MIELRTLGAAEIVVGRKRLTPKTEGLFALAVYLCVRAGESTSRDSLCEMFWPDAEPGRARHNLRQMLYRLRQAGVETVEDGDLVWVAAETVRSDLSLVLEDGWVSRAAPHEVASAGSFLQHFEPRISEDFATWLERARSSVASRFRRATLQHIDSARREARWLDLESWAEMLLASDPLSEEGTLAKAESIAMTGSKALAVELLDTYVAELGPNSTRIALPASVLRRRISERALDWGARQNTDVPLVGRAGAMRKLTALIESSMKGDGGAVLLHGAPGIGKTRLCIEARSYAVLRGLAVVSVRAEDLRAQRPLGLATHVALLLHEQAGAAAASPAAMGIVRRFIEPAAPGGEQGLGLADSVSLEHLAWALSDLARAAAGERPILLHLDDLHNCDVASLTVLAPLLQARLTGCIAVLATARSHWLAHPEGHLSGLVMAHRLRIPPLSPAESATLVASLSRSLPKPSLHIENPRVAEIAGGNPLFIKELTLRQRTPSARDDRTLTLATVIENRCSLLRQSELRLLRVVSLLGPLATVPRLHAILGKAGHTIADDVESLELDGLLSYGEDGAFVLHECWRDAIDGATPRATRAALAYDCATSLADVVEAGAGFDLEWHQGHLFSLAGNSQQAISCYRQSGNRLMTSGLPAQAAEAYARARSLVTETSEVAHINVLLAAALLCAGRAHDAAGACKVALEQLPKSSSTRIGLRAEAMAILAEAEWRGANNTEDSLPVLAELAVDPRIPLTQRRRCAHAGIRLSFNRDREFAKVFFEACPMPSLTTDDDWAVVAVHLIYETELGSADRVRPLVAQLHSLTGVPIHTRAMLLRHCAFALRVVGEWNSATRIAEESLAIALEGGLPSAALSVAINLVFDYLDQELTVEAREKLALATQLSSTVVDDEQFRSLRHARARLLLVEGAFEECVSLLAPQMASIRSDPLHQRRAMEAACMAVAASKTGLMDLARDAMAITLPVLRLENPPWIVDFAAEAVISTISCMGDPEGAESVRDEYLARRSVLAERPIVPALRLLRAR